MPLEFFLALQKGSTSYSLGVQVCADRAKSNSTYSFLLKFSAISEVVRRSSFVTKNFLFMTTSLKQEPYQLCSSSKFTICMINLRQRFTTRLFMAIQSTKIEKLLPKIPPEIGAFLQYTDMTLLKLPTFIMTY